jgi:multicomponent Na+:H+ antiporter subunit D
MRPFVENFPFFCIFLALVAGNLSATFPRRPGAYRMTLPVTGAIAVLSPPEPCGMWWRAA